MPLTSMTGFARSEASHGALSILIEARCVNGRSSDIKLRLPNGFDHLDKPIRALFQKFVRRGNANVTVNLQREGDRRPRINAETLDGLRAALVERATAWGDPPPQLADLLTLPGVVEMVDPAASDDDDEARDEAILAAASDCAASLSESREAEGRAMLSVLEQLVGEIDQEVRALAQHPDARGDHLMARLQSQVDRLLSETSQLDLQRLHQEVAVLATKADIEEELARLRAHIDAAHSLLAAKEPVGRKLDFLAQEFNREANTICSKASSITVTQHGLALKALIDQIKEQVQNVE
ncbi:MAG: YicC family protein [Rhizobiales bacterium]|nr:YicC family protein [Hyphomicrobiales bacterium]MBO6698477.1 YicC family protein [Hyphomicrobiales bacterium]MBO6735269.1 YicC family protein [Hyphomicrobiales bacterium]MBO6910923.1 YicC family protein [Hyphomicrobiales bacterium]MBO6955966.1 YicC family protein [Hyphomicrobiales bacterium]